MLGDAPSHNTQTAQHISHALGRGHRCWGAVEWESRQGREKWRDERPRSTLDGARGMCLLGVDVKVATVLVGGFVVVDERDTIISRRGEVVGRLIDRILLVSGGLEGGLVVQTLVLSRGSRCGMGGSSDASLVVVHRVLWWTKNKRVSIRKWDAKPIKPTSKATTERWLF